MHVGPQSSECSRALQELESLDKGGDDHAWKRQFVRSMNSLANRKAMAMADAQRGNVTGPDYCDADECMSTGSRCGAPRCSHYA
jgi:hypothetical protein